jgi:hypothetical protein
MLAVVRTGLQRVHSSHQRDAVRQIHRQAQEEERERMDARRSEKIRRGTWHDGRLDCVAGNGVMSELGIGDERMEDDDHVAFGVERTEREKEQEERETKKKQKGQAEIEAVESLPVVVIRNFAARGSDREEIYDVLAEWAASLVENQVGSNCSPCIIHHKLFSSSHTSWSFRITARIPSGWPKVNFPLLLSGATGSPLFLSALPSKPLNAIALSDADAASALAFVKRKLKDADINLEYTREQVASVERLGGRATDLESVSIHSVPHPFKTNTAVMCS